MGFGAAMEKCLKNYVVFDGRASRSEYWFFFLFTLLAYFAALIVDGAMGSPGVIYLLCLLGLFLPSLAVGIRRLHDTDRSGWWYLIGAVPIVGSILLLVWFCTEGTAGPNQYGDEPFDHAPAPVTARSGSYRTDDLDRLERLSEMLARGVITQDEYESQKGAILRAG